MPNLKIGMGLVIPEEVIGGCERQPLNKTRRLGINSQVRQSEVVAHRAI